VEGSVFGAVSLWFLRVYEIPQEGTTEQICAKFTWKKCLVPRSDEFEDQGERSKVKITRDKNSIFRLFRWPACGLLYCKKIFSL